MALDSTEQNPPDAESAGPEGVSQDVALPRAVDPVVRALIVTILLIIILTLVTVAYGLLTNVLGTGAPRTMNEQRLVSTAAAIEAGSVKPEDWTAYISALIDGEQYPKAQEWIDRGIETLDDQEISADMLYMQAELYLAQGQLDLALETADEGLGVIKDTYDAGVANAEESGAQMNPAVAFGISDNYWSLLLLKGEAYVGQEDWEPALATYDEYLADNATAATVFTLRGQVKQELGDRAGAEADYRRTLDFIADDAEALAGLERIGASE